MSSPLFELEVQGNPIASAAINEELKLLLGEGELCQEVVMTEGGVFIESAYVLGMETMVVVGVLFMRNVQVDEYWSIKERDNFAKYCHPMRNGIKTQFREVGFL